MDLKKLAPWNWFKHEEELSSVPVKHSRNIPDAKKNAWPINKLQQEMDQLLDNFPRGFGLFPFKNQGLFSGSITEGLLKPTLDLAANDKEYVISVEVPGVDRKDVKIEISDNVLTIKGEKRNEREEKEGGYYRMERSYGSFQRVLSLPEDADQDKVEANFKNGILTVTMPRRALPQSKAKQIEIK